MMIHIVYYAGRIVYSILEKRGKKFLILDLMFIVICLTVVLVTQKYLRELFFGSGMTNLELNKILYSGLYFVFFFIPSLLSRFLSKTATPEQSQQKNEKTDQLIIIPDGVENPRKIDPRNKVTIGIIDFTWLMIMGLAYCGLLYCQEFEIFKENIQICQNTEYYSLYYDEIKFLLQESINLAIILGTILGVCMTIIWGGEIWRKKDDLSKKDYKMTTLGAMRMVIAFFVVVISEIIWISGPLYLKLSSIKEFL